MRGLDVWPLTVLATAGVYAAMPASTMVGTHGETILCGTWAQLWPYFNHERVLQDAIAQAYQTNNYIIDVENPSDPEKIVYHVRTPATTMPQPPPMSQPRDATVPQGSQPGVAPPQQQAVL